MQTPATTTVGGEEVRVPALLTIPVAVAQAVEVVRGVTASQGGTTGAGVAGHLAVAEPAVGPVDAVVQLDAETMHEAGPEDRQAVAHPAPQRQTPQLPRVNSGSPRAPVQARPAVPVVVAAVAVVASRPARMVVAVVAAAVAAKAAKAGSSQANLVEVPLAYTPSIPRSR